MIFKRTIRRRILLWYAALVREAWRVELATAEMAGYKRGYEFGYEEGVDRGFDKAVMHQIRAVGDVERGASERFAAQVRGIG